jgi:protein phosphatase
MKCDFFSLSDAGRVRPNNEDAVAVVPDAGLAVLADGMGGYNAGEVASAMATQIVSQSLRASPSAGAPNPRELRQRVLRSVQEANEAIHRASLAQPAYRGMGTTLVLAVFHGVQVTVAHAGDSRLYRLRQGQLTPLTRDHSLLQEQIDAGLLTPELARTAQHKNLVTRALGVMPFVESDIAEHAVQPGDTYLLCSDGLNDMLTDGEMAAILKRETALQSAGRALIDAANAAGGRDNISLVLVRCSPTPRHGEGRPAPQASDVPFP